MSSGMPPSEDASPDAPPPPPPLPLPAVPLAAGAPLMALEYSRPVRRRPGILTAVGVISICLGGLGALSSASSIIQTVIMASMGPRVMAKAAVAPPVVAPTTATTTAPTTTVAVAPAAGFVGVFPSLDAATAALAISDGVVGLALAVFLLVLGVFIFRDAPFGRRGHLTWACLKLPAAALTAWSSWAVMRSMMANFNAAMGPGTPGMAFADTMAVWQAVFSAGIACIYPVAVLIVMRTRAVKAYYAAGAGAAAQ